MMTCPLCNHSFEPAKDNCHQGCPVNAYCNLVKCPTCGYEMPRDTALVRWVKKLVRYQEEEGGACANPDHHVPARRREDEEEKELPSGAGARGRA